MKTTITTILLMVLMSGTLMAQDQLYQEKEFVVNKDTLKYRIMYPKGFSEDKQYPLVLFLHGAGERGSDNASQLIHGSSLFASEENRKNFPSVVIFPQCPKESYWANVTVDRNIHPYEIKFPAQIPPSKPLSLVMQLMDQFVEESYVKKEQLYVGGLSMGGMGTFELLYRKPEMFAAAFAICGGGNTETVKKYAGKTALWVFHGAKDDIVDPQLSINMVSAYLKAGGTPNFTLYEEANHNSWDAALAEPELLPWLFSKTKPSTQE
ncbi:prolyl oligopeptidase family serine peptidase [Galbibacter sp. EGI 63066]|uniref:carboxylesterase family protein n=1 Tax=Galbibacter sp. EGI 63066 TaxID=2993559 RepID=UPI0022497BAA|nr:alpha/beta hydrolase-fold protein [Galbibacter sp. EGI 63066]MCX2679297.1 prolyl oligopeptidase family serine peptidase [Galbibacter sp. EGI 63066]